MCNNNAITNFVIAQHETLKETQGNTVCLQGIKQMQAKHT
jgi:hypothetical protein